MSKDITGIILAGGKSKRIGADKGLLNFNGKTFVENIYGVVKTMCQDIMIISNQPGYEKLGIPVYRDLVENSGPLAGIYTGLTYSNTFNNLVVGCDMPFISTELLEYLIGHLNNKDVIVPAADDQLQPLCALYTKNCLNLMEKFLKNGNLQMQQVIKQLDAKYIIINEALDFYDPRWFFNINTREDIELIPKKNES